jgi:HSP20 family protein
MAGIAKSNGKKKSSETAVPAEIEPRHPFHMLHGQIDRLFDDFYKDWSFGPTRGSWLRPFGKAMDISQVDLSADIVEKDNGYEISVEMPGVDEKDTSISVTDGTITIKGEKKTEHEEKKDSYYLTERSFGSFQRSFRLPDDVADDRIDAKYAKGVLTVTMPKTKSPKAKARNIEIKPA